MTPETERERRSNQIVKHADIYGSDPNFKMMVDNTVYLSQEQREKSALYVDDVYGTCNDQFAELRYTREYGA
jgi:hypothetical protein